MHLQVILGAEDCSVDVNSAKVTRHEGKVATRKFLDAYPDCSYTTLVTMCERQRVTRGIEHGARVGLSFDALCNVLGCIRDGLMHVLEKPELCVVIIRSSSTEVRALGFIHDGVGSAGPGVCVDVHGAPRENPGRKCTTWSVARRGIESARRADAKETLLVRDGRIYEGTVTNVYFIRSDGAVITAPEHVVLPGTLRAVVLAACHDTGLEVILECPKVEHLPTYQAAFLTNVSRGVQFINQVCFGDNVFKYSQRAYVDHISDAVATKLENEAKKF